MAVSLWLLNYNISSVSMGVWKIWNTNGGINMGTDSYYINENNEFVIEDYNQQKPFK